MSQWNRHVRVVSQRVWESLSPLGKFAALGFGLKPPVSPRCKCARCQAETRSSKTRH